MAGLLRKKIIVRNYNEEIYSKETFGLVEEILLLRVPVWLPSVDENIRLSHLVPAVLFMPEEKGTMDVCICKSVGVCSEDKSLGWMACNVCCLWAHTVLAQASTVLSAIKRDFKCG